MIRLAAALLVALPCHVFAETLSGKVIGITDGDTLKVLDSSRIEIKVRLAGIDSPEKNQAFGQRAKQKLSDLVFGKKVQIDCRKKKSYDRQVCVVYLGDTDINLEQVKAGMAWWSRKYAHEQTERQRIDYETAERNAIASRIGLWRDANPVPPWEWRHGAR